MAYEELGSIDVVTLGGVNKETGKNNPTQIEGYLVNIEQRPNRFNPSKPQNFYVFKTQHGLKGVYGKAGIDSVLKGATLGAMTKLVATDELLDTGKGNPMKVFKGYQDRNNTTGILAPSSSDASDDEEGSYSEELGGEEEETYTPPAQVTRPANPAKAPTSDKIAAMQALLKNKHSRSV